MFTRENNIEIIRRTGRKAWLILVGCLLVTLVRAQCPGCDNTIGVRPIWRPGYIVSNGSFGWNPWGVDRTNPRIDPRFWENGGVYPNNDGKTIAGLEVLEKCATWCPLYNDKLFFYDPARDFTRSFILPVYATSRISQDDDDNKKRRWSTMGIIFSTSGSLTQFCSPNSLTITPKKSDVGVNSQITMVMYCHENAGTFCNEFYNNYSSFNYTVETPQWTSNTSDFISLCQDVDRNFNLADYFSVSGVDFNIDNAGDTTWQFPDFPIMTREYQLARGFYGLDYPLIWVYDPDPSNQDGGRWEYDYTATPDTAWKYPDFPNYNKDYQRANNMYTANATYVTQFNPHKLLPGVHTILAMKTYDNGVYDARFGSHRGIATFPLTITVLPAAPEVGNVSKTPSCNGVPNGTIAITGVTGGDGNYRYILRKGFDNNNTCDPTAGTCFDVVASGSFSGSSYTITGQQTGPYTLWIANNGGATGACARTYNIFIDRLSKMDTLPIAIQHINCPAGNDGFINVTDTGGLAPYTFALTSSQVSLNNNNGQFPSLKAGAYTMVTKDGCGQSIQRTIVLTEPLPVTINATASATDCNNPANGTIEIDAAGGSGTFDYYLYDNTGRTVSQQLASTAKKWSVPALSAGKYTAAVKNTAATGCSATVKNIEVQGPPPISISYVSQTNNKCPNDALGAVRFNGSGGQENGYIFYLQNTATGNVQQSTTGNFSALPAAIYKAWIRNRDLSCVDSTIYASPVTITAPAALQVSSTAIDITCNGKGDGVLQSATSGGTPGYNLQWQQWNEPAANWQSLNGKTAASANSMQKGTYRLQVTDANSCSTYSNSVVIAEPEALLITGVNYTDIVCYGGTGSISMNATGGNGNYTYSRSTDNGNSWRSFTASTALPAASYQVRVSDAKGCVTTYSTNVIVTAPAAPLAITYALTDYNGYNVPCHGSTSGEVAFNATGGNGSSYAGYTFSVDNGAFSAANIITTSGGNHNFAVKDGRGCIVNTAATLTEPAAQIVVRVANKHDNDCAGGKAGDITVQATGGVPQYTFSINGAGYQSSPVFKGLVSGTYQISARDANGCASSDGTSVVDLNKPIATAVTINNVSCYSGSNGSITLSPRGGVPVYSYAWKNSAITGNVLSGLQAGNYDVTITDSKGCVYSDNFTVQQPMRSLSASTNTRPVCFNNPYGNIFFEAQGGTPPYAYSIDGGTRFSNDPKFSNVLANNYSVKVMDANGCEWTGTSAVVTNSINPTLNFLVSTKQNALDTLQVKEVCIPKPDSIQWTFDPRTIVIDNNMFNPFIRYNQQGNYPVAMRAWYSGCDFVTSKVITINPYDAGVINNYNNLFGFDTVIVSPNPSNGNFKLQVKLYRSQRLFIKIYSVTGAVLWNKQWDYTSEIQESVSLPSNIGNGIVFIKLLTDDDARDVQMLITK